MVQENFVLVKLTDRFDGVIPKKELTEEYLKDIDEKFKVGDVVEAVIIEMNEKRKSIVLSPKKVKEMEEKGYLRKANAAEDGRITYISLTEEGRKLSEKYNENYFAGLAPYLESISEADAKVMIQTIETFYQVMCERREYFEK